MNAYVLGVVYNENLFDGLSPDVRFTVVIFTFNHSSWMKESFEELEHNFKTYYTLTANSNKYICPNCSEE